MDLSLKHTLIPKKTCEHPCSELWVVTNHHDFKTRSILSCCSTPLNSSRLLSNSSLSLSLSSFNSSIQTPPSMHGQKPEPSSNLDFWIERLCMFFCTLSSIALNLLSSILLKTVFKPQHKGKSCLLSTRNTDWFLNQQHHAMSIRLWCLPLISEDVQCCPALHTKPDWMFPTPWWCNERFHIFFVAHFEWCAWYIEEERNIHIYIYKLTNHHHHII